MGWANSQRKIEKDDRTAFLKQKEALLLDGHPLVISNNGLIAKETTERLKRVNLNPDLAVVVRQVLGTMLCLSRWRLEKT